MRNEQLVQVEDVLLQAVAISDDNLSDRVQEEVLLGLWGRPHQLEDASEEDIRLADGDVAHADRRCEFDIFLWMLEQLLHSRHDSRLAGQVDDFAVLTECQRTYNQLVWILRGDHGPKLVQHGRKLLTIGNSDCKTGGSTLTLEVDEVEEHLRGAVLEDAARGCHFEEVLDRLLEPKVALNQLRARGLNRHADHGLMRRWRVVGEDDIGGDFERKISLLQVLVTNHDTDFILDHLGAAGELARVAPGKRFETLKSVEVQGALLLLQEIKEGR